MKKIVSIIFIVVLLLTTINIAPFFETKVKAEIITTEDGIVFDTSTGTITDYAGSATTLNIPSSIDGVDVTAIGDNAFFRCSSLSYIELPNSITSIGWNAFRECTLLDNIIIPDSVQELYQYAFAYCSSLQEINIPPNLNFIDQYVFLECGSLNSVTISEGVPYLGTYMFQKCNGLTKVIIPGSVSYIGQGAFQECGYLSEIFICDGVKKIEMYAFMKTSLKKIRIPESVTYINSWAFLVCPNVSIYGVLGSRAEEVANNEDIPFVPYYPSNTPTQKFSVSPYYPISSNTPTIIYNDCTSYRYLRLITEDRLSFAGQEVNYQYAGQSTVYTGTTDGQGRLQLQVPNNLTSGTTTATVTISVGEYSQNNSFSVTRDNYTTNSSQTLFVGMDAGASVGLSANAGPVDVSLASAGIGVGAGYSQSFRFNNIYNNNFDLNVENKVSASVKAAVSVGPSAGIGETELGATASLSAETEGYIYGGITIDNYPNNDDRNQIMMMLALESAKASSMGLKRFVLQLLLDETCDDLDYTNYVYYGYGAGCKAGAAVSVGGSYGSVGVSAVDAKGSLYSKVNVQKYTDETTRSLTMGIDAQASALSMEIDYIDVGFSHEIIAPVSKEVKFEYTEKSGYIDELAFEYSNLETTGTTFGEESHIVTSAFSFNYPNGIDKGDILNDDGVLWNDIENVYNRSLNYNAQIVKEIKHSYYESSDYSMDIGGGLGLSINVGADFNASNEYQAVEKYYEYYNSEFLLLSEFNNPDNIETYAKDNAKSAQDLLDIAMADLQDFYSDCVTQIKETFSTVIDFGKGAIEYAGEGAQKLWSATVSFMNDTIATETAYYSKALSEKSSYISSVVLVEVVDENDVLVESVFPEPLTLSLKYDYDMILASGHDASIESDLAIFMLDEDTNSFVKLVSTVDTVHLAVTANIYENGEYVIGYDDIAPEFSNVAITEHTQDTIISVVVLDDFSSVAGIQMYLDETDIINAANYLNYYTEGMLIYDFAGSGLLANGNHHIYFTALDAEGNSVTTSTIDFYIDNTVPTVASVSHVIDENGNLSVSYSAQDEHELGQVLVNVNYQGSDKVVYSQSMAVESTGVVIPSEILKYSISYEIIATDSAGNTAKHTGIYDVDFVSLEITSNISQEMTLMPNQLIEIEFNKPIFKGENFAGIEFDIMGTEAQIQGNKLVLWGSDIVLNDTHMVLTIPENAIVDVFGNSLSQALLTVHYYTDHSDLDKNGEVDLLDLIILSQNFGSTVIDADFVPSFDFNEDGYLNLYDVVVIAKDIS